MITTLIVLVKMIAAHLLGDFIFQSDAMCQRKFSSKSFDKYSALILHALVQGCLTYIFIAQWDNLFIPFIIFLSHFCIDWIKSMVKGRGLMAFIIDQIAHYFVMFLLWWIYFIELSHSIDVTHYIFSFKVWVLFTAFIVVLSPSSILIKLFLEYEKWSPDSSYYKGLPNAGKWIGYLERFLILIFIFTNNIEGVGFLLAAKSIFRYGELNRAKDLKITEYVLVGTFASFSIAISIAYLAKYIISLSLE